MSRIQAFVLDDEEQGRNIIKKLLLQKFPEITVSEASSINEAIPQIIKHSPDIVFLDVQLRGETGFDLLNKFDFSNTAIIFVTAHDEYAVKAFKHSAIDYLLKPLDVEEFERAVFRALNSKELKTTLQQTNFLLQQIQNKSALPTKLTIPTADGFVIIPISTIIYCKASSNYTEFYLSDNQRLISSYNLGFYNGILSDHNFFRVHRSFLINTAQIKRYKKGDGGSVVMNNNDEIEVARNNKDAFLGLFKS